MSLFRLFLATCLVAIIAYTSVTIANHGFNLVPIFFGGMLFLSIYLLVHTGRARGDMKVLLLGERRPA